MGYSLLQLSPEEEIEVRSYLAAIEIEERRKEIERKAQLQLMAGQLDRLANQNLEEAKK